MPEPEAEKRKETGALAWKGGKRVEPVKPGGVGAGTTGRLAGRGCLRSWPLLSIIRLLIQVASCVLEWRSQSQKSGKAEPRALGCFSREDSLPPASGC